MALMQTVTGMSPAGKTAAGAGGTGVALTVVGFITGVWMYVAYIAATLVVAALLVLALRWVFKRREKGRSMPFVGRLLGTAAGSPTTADPAMRARIDDLRRKFEEGMEKFRAAGKDVYSLPWVLMAGPSGSGKTEAVRHCNVGFPPGLQDPLQGTGGTLNMNWWFTNHAVVLDTAGKMFMEEGGGEWKELMKLLKSWRPLQPINGMVLAIGVDSLIKDSAEKIEQEASKVARQLDSITRDLDVRFPVYMIVTKCDLLTGFREFFTTITDPQLQHQMLGWSNPDDLDEPFHAERVTEHLEQVCRKLVRRRGALLSDPTPQNMQAASPRRMDEVDALYALPESLGGIGSRLRRYLELIFVQGEWSAKPLFLRGIYFTSALQEGRELDEAIARAMGVPVDALPGGGTFRNEKSYFLRDLLMQKVFAEKGLVTRATNVKQQQRGRKLALVGSGIGVVVLCLVFTWLGYRTLAGTAVGPAKTWKQVSEEMSSSTPRFFPVVKAKDASPGEVVAITDPETGRTSFEWSSPAELLAATSAQSSKGIHVPAALRMLALESLDSHVKHAHSAVTEVALVRPLVKAARDRFTTTAPQVDWVAHDSSAIKVLASLIQIEQSIGGGKFESKTSFPVGDYLRFTASAAEIQNLGGDTAISGLQEAVRQAFGETGTWPPEGMKGASDIKAVDAAARSFNEHWPKRLESDPQVGKIIQLQSALEKFDAADKALAILAAKHDTNTPLDSAKYKEFGDEWNIQYARLLESWKVIEPSLGTQEASDFAPLIDKAGDSINRTIEESYRSVLGLGSPDSALGKLTSAATNAATKAGDSKDAVKQAGDVVAGVLEEGQFAGAPEAVRPILISTYKAGKSLQSAESPVRQRLAMLKSFFGDKGSGAALLRSVPASDLAVKRVIAVRFDAYTQANEIFTQPAPIVSWGAVKTAAGQSLKDAVDAIDADLQTRIGLVEQRSKAAGDTGTEPTGSAMRASTFAARVAAIGRRTAALDAVLQQRKGPEAQWLRTRVSEVSDELAAVPASPANPSRRQDKIELPLPIDPSEMLLSREFDPGAAKRVLGDGAEVLALTEAPKPGSPPLRASDARVIEPQARTQAIMETMEAFTAYASHYFNDWVSKPAQAMVGVKPKTWIEYKDSLSKDVMPSRADVSSKLRNLSDLMSEALAAIPASLESRMKLPAGQGLADWAKVLKDSNEAVGDNDLTLSIKNWMQLEADHQAAANEIGNMRAAEFLSRYFSNYNANSKLVTPTSKYWDTLRLEALTKLVRDYRMSQGGRYDSIERLYKLPLALISPGKPWGGSAAQIDAMTMADARYFRDDMGVLAASITQKSASRPASGVTIASGDRTNVATIDSQLDRMLAGNAVTNDRRAPQLIEAWTDWLKVVAADDSAPLRATFWVLPNASVSAVSAETDKYESKAGIVAWFSVTIDGKQSAKLNPAAAGTTGIRMGTEFPVYSPSVRLDFSDAEKGDGALNGTRELKSGWTVLELLSDPDVRPWGDANDGKRWMVPVRFNDSSGKPCYIWVGIEFNTPLPANKSKWPGSELWKE